jgi:hypothetical protein
LIKLDQKVFVNPEEVIEVVMNNYDTHVVVHMKNGLSFAVLPDKGEKLSAALKRIVAQINDACGGKKKRK